MKYPLSALAEHLKSTNVEISMLLKKLGYKKTGASWNINDIMAKKVIKAFRLFRATKPSKRHLINFKAIRLAPETIFHKKPLLVFHKPKESNTIL